MKYTTFFLFLILFLTVFSEGKHIKEKKGNKESKEPNNSKDESRSEKSSESEESTDEDNTESFQIIINSDRGYYIPFNKTANKVAFLDYRKNTSALLDGDGTTFIFHYEDGSAIMIPPSASPKTWDKSKESLDKYLKHMPTLEELASEGLKSGIQFRSDSISEDISVKMAEIFGDLSMDYNSQCEALATAIGIAKITSDSLKMSLSGFETVVGSTHVNPRGDLKWLVGALQGLSSFFEPFDGGVHALVEKKLNLNFGKIMSEPSGFHVLIYLLGTLKPNFDLGKLLGNSLNSEYSFFVLVNKLSGEINYGLDGFVYVVSEIVSFKYGKNSKFNLKIILRNYYKNPRAQVENVEENWKSSIQEFLETLKKLQLDKDFPDLTKLLKNILEEKWYCKKTNMSNVIKKILSVRPPGDDQEIESILELLEDSQ